MTISYIAYHPEQQQLLPTALQDWLPEGHIAHYISEAVDQLDLSAFHARYANGGPRNQPYHPAMMVKVLIYGYCQGVFSSRKIAARLHEDIACRMLAANNFPAARTLRQFRLDHLSEFEQLFTQVVLLARELGLVKLGTVAIDGTKLKANASRHKAMSYGRMLQSEREIKEQISQLLAKAQSTDQSEADQQSNVQDIPAELQRRQDRLAAIASAKEQLQERQRQADLARGRSRDDQRQPRDEDGKPKGGRPYARDFGVPPDKAQCSFTDADSRIMRRSGGGFDYAYNGQTAVDEQARIIIAAELVNTSADVQQMPAVLQVIHNTFEQDPVQVLADAGYRSEQVMAQLAKDRPDTDLVIALGREGKALALKCDADKYPNTAAMAKKLQSEPGQRDYRKRKWIAEPPNGWIKAVLGFRQFSMRTLKKCQAEFKLVCMAVNLRRMSKMITV
jgi:transposase